METIKRLSEDILIAIKVCPDFNLTSSGPYRNNHWTDFADAIILTQPDQDLGFNINNYQSWLDWSYEKLAENNDHDPLMDYSRNLKDVADNRFGIPWLMSFADKGFNIQNEVKTSSRVMFKTLETKDWILERESIPNRFGERVLIERTYNSEYQLADIVMVHNSEKGLILRFDDPRLWNYQQWHRDFYIGGSAKSPLDLFRINESIPDHIFSSRLAVMSVYDNELYFSKK
jgi:hypothetical protein